jgi:AraC-like DNA-binding protein
MERLASATVRDLRLTEAQPLSASRSVFEQGTAESYDMHLACEMGVVLQGRFRRIDRENDVFLTRGHLWWHGPWEPHGWSAEEKTVALVFVCLPSVFYGFPSADLSPYLPFVRPGLRAFLQPGQPDAEEAVCAQAEVLHREVVQRATGWTVAAQLDLMRLIVDRLRAVPEPVLMRSRVESESSQIFPLLEHVHGRLQSKLTLAGAASLAHMGRTRFAQAFREVVGTTFAQYVLRCRLDGARRDLLHTGDKLAVIAFRWGFTDASHLCRQYRRRFGVPPSAGRQ